MIAALDVGEGTMMQDVMDQVVPEPSVQSI